VLAGYERDRVFGARGYAKTAGLALIWVCHVGGHAAVDAIADLAKDSELSEVVGIDAPDLEDVVGAYPNAVAFRFTAAMIDDWDRRWSRRSAFIDHFDLRRPSPTVWPRIMPEVIGRSSDDPSLTDAHGAPEFLRGLKGAPSPRAVSPWGVWGARRGPETRRQSAQAGESSRSVVDSVQHPIRG
jgi:hypothetical protein